MDAFFGLDKPHAGDLAAVGTYYDAPSLAVAESLLTGAGIPYQKKERGTGGVLTIVAGYNMYGTDLLVRKEDEEAAAALLAPAEESAE